jgi:hypothetical protein
MIEFSPLPPLWGAGGSNAQVEEQQKKAMEEDPSVFAYDEVYDDMKEKEARPKMQAKVVREVIPPSWLRQLLICALVLRLCSLRCVKEYS